MRPLLLSMLFGLVLSSLHGQTVFDRWIKPDSNFRIQPYFMVQFWSTYTMNQEAQAAVLAITEPVDDRINFQLRRARLGFRANPYPRLKFNLALFYDLIGRDVLAGTVGGENNTANLGVWDAYGTWQMGASDRFHLTAGYFRPQFSRESITSGWAVNSFEKAMSQNYIRRNLVGSGAGRAVGINLGGLWAGSNVNLNYNVGLFTPQATGRFNNSGGADYSPLLVGRVVVGFGDPEMEAYDIAYDINYFNARKGVSLGGNLAYQDGTDLFASSLSVGGDVLVNYGPLNLDGELVYLRREGNTETVDAYSAVTGHARIGVNVILGRFFLEPTAMVMVFEGEDGPMAQQSAIFLDGFSGSDRSYDVGVNWYLNRKRLKVLLHYTWRDGSAGNNQFFRQSDVGAIQRGDWIALGVHTIF